jgi:hypothetical protein
MLAVVEEANIQHQLIVAKADLEAGATAAV